MDDENEVIEDNQQVEDAPELDETPAPETPEAPEAEDVVIVQIGEEAPPPEEQNHAPEWVRELRKSNRELQRQNRELQSRLQTTEPRPAALGKKPSLEDHEYDADKYEAALSSWFEQKRQFDDEQAKAQRAAQEQEQAWKNQLQKYQAAKASLKVRDYDEAETVVEQVLSVTQQGVVIQGAENPEMVVYALGKNPKKAQELASIKDPVKFAFAVAKLEAQLKVVARKPAIPPPEKVPTGSGRVSGAVDSTLERLRDEAAKTGDMSKVMAYKRQKRA